MRTLHVEFEIPGITASQAGLNPKNISLEAKRMLALFLYEHGRISLSKACEIGGMTHWEFADMNRQLGIPSHYSAEDMREDMEKLSDV